MLSLNARGPTITLRYPEPADARALFELAADPGVTRHFSWRYTSADDAARWIAGRQQSRDEGHWLEFVIEHAEHGVTGVTGLTEPNRRDRRAVTGSWLGSPYWGAGINTEAKALLARIAFEALGLDRLGSYAGPNNHRSRAALLKLGFVHEGTLRHYHHHNGRSLDVDVFSLLREEWAAGPLSAVPAEIGGEPPAAFRAA